MEGISDIRIIGIDKTRPPRIRQQPYIDIVFQLSHQAPEVWCKDFNSLLSKHPTTPKIKVEEGLYIESWVRIPDEIVPYLEMLKEKVLLCNQEYIERIERSIRNANNADANQAETGEQGRLNLIIAGLDYGEVMDQLY